MAYKRIINDYDELIDHAGQQYYLHLVIDNLQLAIAHYDEFKSPLVVLEYPNGTLIMCRAYQKIYGARVAGSRPHTAYLLGNQGRLTFDNIGMLLHPIHAKIVNLRD